MNPHKHNKAQVSPFDNSMENHFKAMEHIYSLCGGQPNDNDDDDFDEDEIQRFSTNITFLSEWRYFNYKPRTVRFLSESGLPSDNITLPQFSSASVPKCDQEAEKIMPHAVIDSRKDFLLYVGGLVWALDWCPRPDEGTHSDAKCEFVAVAAHPPDSTYHKLGGALTGRGMIQIWCILNFTSEKESLKTPAGKTKRKYQKGTAAIQEDSKQKRPRGRPRKNAIDKTHVVSTAESELPQAAHTLDVPPTDGNLLNSSASLSDSNQKTVKNAAANNEIKSQKPKGRPKKKTIDNSPAVVDPETPSYGALVVHLQQDAPNLALVSDNSPTTTVPLKQRGSKRKCMNDENKSADRNSVKDPEAQVNQALVVHVPEDAPIVLPMDENVLSIPARRKEKARKTKAGTNVDSAIVKIADAVNCEEPQFQALAVEFPDNVPETSTGENPLNASETQAQPGIRKRVVNRRLPESEFDCTISSLKKRMKKKSKIPNEADHDRSKLSAQKDLENPIPASLKEACISDGRVAESNTVSDGISDLIYGGCQVPGDITLPRVVFCLGHDGKVAWDVKWRPHRSGESSNRHRMGYLAVVLGNGSIEVWEIPSPRMIGGIYASCCGESTDPRFAKLKPVFSSSKLKYGNRQSMPLTVEWSASPPHDLLLAGCNDGTVALWKFSDDGVFQDAKPLLCFSAETVPIRALSWAPFTGDPESANIIVTAGHGGLKFWDLRDPFRPLWDAISSQRFIYGLDWSPDPSCLLVSYDDGTLRMLSLSRAACDVPVNGGPFTGTQQQGVHSLYCSPFAIWSIHVSRVTGMAAYCGADGTVLYFELTHKAVDKDPVRNRTPHFLCGSFVDEEPAIVMNTHLPTSPHLMKKSATEWASTPRSARTVASNMNQGRRVSRGTERSQTPPGEVLALCYGDDSGNGEAIETEINSKSGKGKGYKSKKANADLGLICTEGDGTSPNEKSGLKEELGPELETPPSKIVSTYKVRWNMNKGSERWLCYGGASGIVRCQEIVPPIFDKKLLRR